MRNVFPEYPLVVATNRDEEDERPSTSPEWWQVEPWSNQHRIYAPRDLVRGGTWVGVSTRGIIAAVTNREDVHHVSGRRSRGRMVAEALESDNVNEAVERIVRQTGSAYNGFQLLVADAADAFLLVGDGTSIQVGSVADGLLVATAYGFGRGHVPRATEIEQRFEEAVQHDPSPTSLDRLLNFHADGEPRAAACVHAASESHKTRSSMIIRAHRAWSRVDTWHRDGRACASPLLPTATFRFSAHQRRTS